MSEIIRNRDNHKRPIIYKTHQVHLLSNALRRRLNSLLLSTVPVRTFLAKISSRSLYTSKSHFLCSTISRSNPSLEIETKKRSQFISTEKLLAQILFSKTMTLRRLNEPFKNQNENISQSMFHIGDYTMTHPNLRKQPRYEEIDFPRCESRKKHDTETQLCHSLLPLFVKKYFCKPCLIP